MTTDFRALCVELTDCLEKADWPHRYKVVFQQWTDVARAALAEPDGPAVPEGREPAAVASELSDEDIMEMMSEEMRADLAAAACAMAEQSGSDSPRVQGLHRIILNRHAVDLARAVLARWGTSDLTETRSSLDDLALRIERLEQQRETERAALLDAFRQIDELKQRIDFHYGKIHRLESHVAPLLSGEMQP